MSGVESVRSKDDGSLRSGPGGRVGRRRWPLVAAALAAMAVALGGLLWLRMESGPPSSAAPTSRADTGEWLEVGAEPGSRGGSLVAAQRAEPRTLNPLVAADNPSLEIIGRLHASLVRINRATLETEPELATSWEVSPDGRRYTLILRKGVRFSDGDPFDANDVVFTFQAYLDERVGSPQRDLLIVNGRPIEVARVDDYTVSLTLAAPYAAAERIFDGVPILPRHLLETAHRAGTLADAWSLATPPSQVAGLGPFRMEVYVPGQRLVLSRNPHYWKVDRRRTRLPYLDRLAFVPVADESAQAIRLRAGDVQVVSRLGAETFAALAPGADQGAYRLSDLGPGLDYTFLFFNLNDVVPARLPRVSARQRWFRQGDFRRAVSAALDRAAMARLVYGGRAVPIWWHVTPGNRRWMNGDLPRPARSIERARDLLRSAGFSWSDDGALVDDRRQSVEFTLVTNASNRERVRLATHIQDDLRPLGIRVRVVPLEFRALIERVLRSFDYDACLLGLGPGDADPNSEMNVWLSSGAQHLWHPGQSAPATSWEAEVDRLMRQQLVTLDDAERKAIYNRVQTIVARELPIIALVSPHVLVGARAGLANLRPSIVPHHMLWNAEELYWR